MTIRKSTEKDYISIVRSIQNKKIGYITPNLIKKDIEMGRQYIMVDDFGKIIAMLSLVYEPNFNYYSMKRLCVPNKKNGGKGYATMMLDYVSHQTTAKVGCTPWADNKAMRQILTKLGFTLEYIFDGKWCFYSKKGIDNNCLF